MTERTGTALYGSDFWNPVDSVVLVCDFENGLLEIRLYGKTFKTILAQAKTRLVHIYKTNWQQMPHHKGRTKLNAKCSHVSMNIEWNAVMLEL